MLFGEVRTISIEHDSVAGRMRKIETRCDEVRVLFLQQSRVDADCSRVLVFLLRLATDLAF